VAYTISDEMKTIDLGWPSRSVTTSTVGPTLATTGLLVQTGNLVELKTDKLCNLQKEERKMKANAYRTGLSDTPVCECGNDRESAEHYLLHCTRYHKDRVN